MKADAFSTLLAAWAQQGHIDQAAVQRWQQHDGGPWWLGLLVTLAAWCAAVLMIVATMGPWFALVDSAPGRSLYACALLLAAWLLLRGQGFFAGQLGLVLSLSGQIIFVIAWTEVLQPALEWPQAVSAVGLPLALAMFILPAGVHHRRLCALLLLAYVATWLADGLLLLLYAAVLSWLVALAWLTRRHWAIWSGAVWCKPALEAATLTSLMLALFVQAGWHESSAAATADLWLQGYRLTLVALALVASGWIFSFELGRWRWSAPLLCAALLLLLFKAPALVLAATMGMVAFHARSWLWSLLTPLFALLALSEWYYNLQLSLLHKSMLLMLAGAVLLLVYGVWLRSGGQAG